MSRATSRKEYRDSWELLEHNEDEGGESGRKRSRPEHANVEDTANFGCQVKVQDLRGTFLPVAGTTGDEFEVQRDQGLERVEQEHEKPRKRAKTDWAPPPKYSQLSEEDFGILREAYGIKCTGSQIPPLVLSFKDMGLPNSMLQHLEGKGIKKPSYIQMQGLPVALSGRDLIGIAPHGTGKTLVYLLPLLMAVLREECRMPLGRGRGPRGPTGLILCATRECASQTFQLAMALSGALSSDGLPQLINLLCVGGKALNLQFSGLQMGVHLIIGTAGRIGGLVASKALSLYFCRCVCLDNVDVLLTLGPSATDEIFDGLKNPLQILAVSTRMNQRVDVFCKSTMVDPIVVTANSNAPAADPENVQEVGCVKKYTESGPSNRAPGVGCSQNVGYVQGKCKESQANASTFVAAAHGVEHVKVEPQAGPSGVYGHAQIGFHV